MDVNVEGIALENLGVDGLVGVKGEEGPDETTIDVYFGVGDEDDLEGAEYDQEDAQQGSLGKGMNELFGRHSVLRVRRWFLNEGRAFLRGVDVFGVGDEIIKHFI